MVLVVMSDRGYQELPTLSSQMNPSKAFSLVYGAPTQYWAFLIQFNMKRENGKLRRNSY